MEFVRLVHPRHFDHQLGKFTDLAVKNSSDGGMSAFQLKCAEETSGGLICAHIEQYYKGVGGEPPVFFIFDDAALPEGGKMQQCTSDSGDECHHEVLNVSDKQLKKRLRPQALSEYLTCAEAGVVRALTEHDAKAFPR